MNGLVQVAEVKSGWVARLVVLCFKVVVVAKAGA